MAVMPLSNMHKEWTDESLPGSVLLTRLSTFVLDTASVNLSDSAKVT